MNDGAVIQTFRKKKTIQLSLFILLEIFFFLTLIINEDFRSGIFTNYIWLSTLVVSLLLFALVLISFLQDKKLLRKLADMNERWHRLAYMDKTGIPNRYSLDLMFQSYSTPESLENVGCCLFTIKNLEEVNKKSGREAGDELIRSFCTMLDESGAKYGYVGRNGGNEFVMVLENCSKATMTLIYASLDKRLYLYNEQHPLLPLKIKRAYTLNSTEKCSTLFGLLAATYNKLQ